MSNAKTSAVSDYAESILKRNKIFENVYFTQLLSGEMNLETFRETQVQFYFAVDFFSRPMSALIARIPDPRLRLKILHNILDEHGDMKEDAFHEYTFKQFLQSIGQPDLNFKKITIWPQLRAFNSTLATACTLDEIEVGVAALGIIERAFADISAIIAKGVVKRGWVPEKNLTHYNLHADLDIEHAADFFDIIEPQWQDATKQHFIKQGLELGAYIFDRLYHDLVNYKMS